MALFLQNQFYNDTKVSEKDKSAKEREYLWYLPERWYEAIVQKSLEYFSKIVQKISVEFPPSLRKDVKEYMARHAWLQDLWMVPRNVGMIIIMGRE